MDRKVSQSKHYSFRVPGKWWRVMNDFTVTSCWGMDPGDALWTRSRSALGLNLHSESRAETSQPRDTFLSINLCSSLGFWCYQALERTNKAITSLLTRQLSVWILSGTLTDRRPQPEDVSIHHPPDFGGIPSFLPPAPVEVSHFLSLLPGVPLSFLSRQAWRMYAWLRILKKNLPCQTPGTIS